MSRLRCRTCRDSRHPIEAVWLNDDPVSGWLVIDREPIVTTPDHPFFAVGRGWVEAGQLAIGDLVPSASGEVGVVTAMTWSRGRDQLYDLTVAEAHTFYVGEGAWLVHNCTKPVHGNSYASTKPTSLYRAFSRSTGTFLKWGISSNLKKRYPSTSDIFAIEVRTGSRAAMAALERRLVRRFGGPLNREPWSRSR